MPLGPLVLRVVAGGLFVGHGAQKLFGFFGGHGLNRTGAFFESLRARFPGGCWRLVPVSASWPVERCSCSGLVTPLAAALLIAVMVTAVATVHWLNDVWVTDGDVEYNLVLGAIAFAVAATGAGKGSLDHVLGLHVPGVKWALAVLVVGVLAGIAAIAVVCLRPHGATDATPVRA